MCYKLSRIQKRRDTLWLNVRDVDEMREDHETF